MPFSVQLMTSSTSPYSTLCSAAHKAVALGIALNHFHGLPGVLCQSAVEPLSQKQNFLCLNLNIGRLPLCAATGLVDHRPGVGQISRFPLVPPLSKNAPIDAA